MNEVNNKLPIDILSAMITPFEADGRLDYKSLEEHIQWQLESGISGFLLMGPVGEGVALNDKDWETVLKVAASLGRNKILLVEVSAPSKDILTNRLRKAEKIGATGVTALPPPWFGYSAEVTANYYRHLVETTPLPVYIHNMPRVAGTGLSQEVLRLVVAETEGRLAGMVECSGDWQLLSLARDLLPANYYGRVEGWSRAITEGAVGIIVATANICPRAHYILSMLMDKNVKIAGELEERLSELSRSIHVGQPVAAAIKAILMHLGRGEPWTSFPVVALTGPRWAEWASRTVKMVNQIEEFCRYIELTYTHLF